MGVNPIETSFLAAAIDALRGPYEKLYGRYDGHFYIGRGITFIEIMDGPDKGRLTVGKNN